MTDSVTGQPPAVEPQADESPRETDVVVLGGGVNGAGLFRDLCAQGVDCVLIDSKDFGSGTSAAPSRLIHGGLKYLETGEFGLVAQSTLERNLLLKNAPHTVTPLPTVIPIFSWTRGIPAALRTLFGSTDAPRSRGALLIKTGLWLYDRYGARENVMPRHEMLGRRRALREIPGLTPSIVAAGAYHDAKVSQPERLVLELVTDGLDRGGRSLARNYTALTGVSGDVLHFTPEGGAPFSIRPKLVVNAAGPWIDRVNAMLGAPSALIGGTRGSHLLLEHDELLRALDGRMIYFEADDGRICLVFEHLGRALVGSTDIPDDDPDAVHAHSEEIDYLLASVRSLMPGITIERDQIVYAYSGIRPLPASDASAPGLISRDHSAPVAEPDGVRTFPIISLVGGKWTTFRGFAEEVADTVLERLGRERRTSTRMMPIGGGNDFPAAPAARRDWLAMAAESSGLDSDRLETLLERYGTTALRVARHRARWSEDERLADAPDFSLVEIDRIARDELVVRLSDIVMRRTTLSVTGSLSARDLDTISRVTAEALGWDDARRGREVAATATELGERHLTKL